VTPAQRVAPILAEQMAVFARIPPETLEAVVEALLAAPRVLLWAQGRTGYALMALAMRLEDPMELFPVHVDWAGV